MQQQIEQLNNRIAVLEKLLNDKSHFEEMVRDIVFFDIDNVTAPTRTATDSRGDTVTVPANPAKFATGYFRGQVYNFALYIKP